MLDRAERVLDRHACRGCHRLGGNRPGGTFGPDLSLAGLRFGPNWLDRYLATPAPVRPEAEAVMPTYALDAAERLDLSLWFESTARTSPEAALVRAAGSWRGDAQQGEVLVERHACGDCHLAGDQREFPRKKTPHAEADLARWRKQAPRLADLAGRLDPAWTAAFLQHPRRFLPGTPMPDFHLTEGEAASIRDYLFGLRTTGGK